MARTVRSGPAGGRHLGKGSTQDVEQGGGQALGGGLLVLDQGRQLVMVAHQGEGTRLQQGAQAGRQGNLARLIYDAHVKHLVLQHRVVCSQGRTTHLQDAKPQFNSNHSITDHFGQAINTEQSRVQALVNPFFKYQLAVRDLHV